MKNRVITISREFGSGGRTIGKMVAQRLGIPCYDAEIIENIAVITLKTREKAPGKSGSQTFSPTVPWDPQTKIKSGSSKAASLPDWRKRDHV